MNTISFLSENRNKNRFNETQNIIIIETDGKNSRVSNTTVDQQFSCFLEQV